MEGGNVEAHAATTHSGDNHARGDGEKKEEAEGPCSQGLQQSVGNVILHSKNGVTQPTTCVQKIPGGQASMTTRATSA